MGVNKTIKGITSSKGIRVIVITLFREIENDNILCSMDRYVKVVSYNCRGLSKLASKLCEKPSVNLILQDIENDIICFQETFYSKQDLSCLNYLHNDFQGIGTSTTDARDKVITGHPAGGVAILYRRKYAKCISPILFNLDWIIGISITVGNKKHVILCVYMKTASGGQGDHK